MASWDDDLTDQAGRFRVGLVVGLVVMLVILAGVVAAVAPLP